MIIKAGNKFRIVSSKGKTLGTYSTREEAVKRLGQIEYFKNKEKEYAEGGKFQEYAKKAQEMRPFARKNPDGSESTVLMASGEDDGKYYVFPTIFPAEGNTGSSDPKDWIEPSDPFREAIKRGELFEFDTEEEAQNFAEGSWKKYTNVKPKGLAPVITLGSK